MERKLAIIGGGNLGSAMAEGLLSSGFVQASRLVVTKRNTASLQSLSERGVTVTSDNREAVQQADWIILAVKPFQVKEVVQQILPVLDPARQV
ncbi:MAG TPA: NAD(P)-binding domain-containing protein, partial [Sediminibacterium sp.]|nr:NAD(P)-binding domain-containing protein [Sediminibacterium sp.]